MEEPNTNQPGPWIASICEFVGTFFLVLIGTGAIVVDAHTQGAIGHVGISLCFGIVVCVVIYSVGHLSGAHINPAVSIGFFATGEIGGAKLLRYLVAQLAGGVAASLLLCGIFSAERGLGATQPNLNIENLNAVVACLVLEFVLTFILMWVILAMTAQAHPHAEWTGLIVGLVIAMEALMAGPVCGASMNPARSIGPALVSGQFEYLWIYILAPIAGALAASMIGPLVLGPRQSHKLG